jgi:hypothetical protein
MPIDERPSEEALRRLVEEARDRGDETVVVEITREVAGAWEGAGFDERSRVFTASVEALERRLRGEKAPSFGSVHVQTDDVDAVVRAVRQYVPRMPGGSQGSVVAQPRNGWVAVYDELCDRMGAVVVVLGVEEGEVVRFVLFERARLMDEYLSVPEYHGDLPPGDVISLEANPTVIARLTGAEPTEVRRVIRTAKRPDELPPASELVAEVARVLGVDGADHGYAVASMTEGIVAIQSEGS